MISFSFQSFARGWLGERGSSMQEVRAGSVVSGQRLGDSERARRGYVRASFWKPN